MIHVSAGGTLLVAQLVEALLYKLEGCGFDSWRCHWNFSLTYEGWSFNCRTDFFRGSYNSQRSDNKAGQVATLCKCTCITGSQYLTAFAMWKPLTERLPAVCVASHDGGETSAHVCASISVSVWGKLVLKCTKCCKQLSESPPSVDQRHLSGLPISKMDADPLKTTPAQAVHPPLTPRRPWHMCET
jgi:hypothetical protein